MDALHRILAGIRSAFTGREPDGHSPAQKIIDFLTTHGAASGAEISQGTGLGSGTLYPALMRLEDRGVIVSKWWRPNAEGYRPRIYSINRATTAPSPSVQSP